MSKFDKLLKELFAVIKQKFADAELKDGTCLRSEGELTTGSKVTLITADGAAMEATDGEYELKDGTVVTIKSGVIDSITDSSNPTPTDEPMVKIPKPSKDDNDTANVIQDAATPDSDDMLAQVIQDLTDRVAALEAAIGAQVAQSAEMSKTVEKFAAAPGAEPIKKKAAFEVPVVYNSFNSNQSIPSQNLSLEEMNSAALDKMLEIRNLINKK